MISRGKSGAQSHTNCCLSTKVEKLSVPVSSRSVTRVVPRVTSYEIIWAAERSPPIKEYLELLAHPAIITECTLSDDRANTYSTPRRKSTSIAPSPMGNTIQPAIARPKVKIGEIRKISTLALLGRIDSLTNSLRPSASGWKRPKKPTIFGPWRRWRAARIWRSYSVK